MSAVDNNKIWGGKKNHGESRKKSPKKGGASESSATGLPWGGRGRKKLDEKNFSKKRATPPWGKIAGTVTVPGPTSRPDGGVVWGGTTPTLPKALLLK